MRNSTVTLYYIFSFTICIYDTRIEENIIIDYTSCDISLPKEILNSFYSQSYKEVLLIGNLLVAIHSDVIRRRLRYTKTIPLSLALTRYQVPILHYAQESGLCLVYSERHVKVFFGISSFSSYDVCLIFVKFKTTSFHYNYTEFARHVKQGVVVLPKYKSTDYVTNRPVSVTNNEFDLYEEYIFEHVVVVKLTEVILKDGLRLYEIQYKDIFNREGQMEFVMDIETSKTYKKDNNFDIGYLLVT